VTRHAQQLFKVKRSKVKVTKSRDVSADKKRYNSAVYGHIAIMIAGSRRYDGPSGDAACDADWVPLTVDDRLTTIEVAFSEHNFIN